MARLAHFHHGANQVFVSIGPVATRVEPDLRHLPLHQMDEQVHLRRHLPLFDYRDSCQRLAKEDNGKAELDEMDLVADERRSFRSEGSTLNYLGQDRTDIQYAVKEICHGMSRPTEGGKARIKMVARYLVGAKRLVWKYREKENDDDEKVDVYVDSDWASGWSRKSPSGGMLTVDGVRVMHWSRTQKGQGIEFWRGRVLRDGDGVRCGLWDAVAGRGIGLEGGGVAVDRQQCREGL